jgi:Zn-dependent peptidase ImmA (M78 family)
LTRADREPVELLQRAGIRKPPVDVDGLARSLGARVMLEGLDPEVSGVLYRLPERLVIAVNRAHPLTRRRFTVAHELGHLVLHQGRPLIVDHVVRARVDLRDSRSSLATEREEIEANRFAANLLIPADFLHRYVQKEVRRQLDETETIQRLAEIFSVSAQAMEIRLTNLGLRAAV